MVSTRSGTGFEALLRHKGCQQIGLTVVHRVARVWVLVGAAAGWVRRGVPIRRRPAEPVPGEPRRQARAAPGGYRKGEAIVQRGEKTKPKKRNGAMTGC